MCLIPDTRCQGPSRHTSCLRTVATVNRECSSSTAQPTLVLMLTNQSLSLEPADTSVHCCSCQRSQRLSHKVGQEERCNTAWFACRPVCAAQQVATGAGRLMLTVIAVDLLVCDRRKAPVACRRVQWQQVEAADCTCTNSSKQQHEAQCCTVLTEALPGRRLTLARMTHASHSMYCSACRTPWLGRSC